MLTVETESVTKVIHIVLFVCECVFHTHSGVLEVTLSLLCEIITAFDERFNKLEATLCTTQMTQQELIESRDGRGADQ